MPSFIPAPWLPDDTSRSPPLTGSYRAPAWLLSLAMHLLIVVLGVLAFRPPPPVAGLDEAVRPAAIVLARRAADSTVYFADESDSAAAPAGKEAANVARDDALTGDVAPAGAAGLALPEWPGATRSGADLVAGRPAMSSGGGRPRLPPAMDEAAVRAADALIPRAEVPTGPTAQLSLFGGAPSQGRSFVFVIDRSKSMGGDGLGAIDAAAKELAEQFHTLSAEQQVQAIASNQSVVFFTGRKLVAADAQHQAALVGFLEKLSAFGQTEHERGLLAALRLKPEVIYLLTDGGDPHLRAGQLRTIRDQADGRTSIHVLHFGRGPGNLAPPDHFLRRLAAENGGGYVYVDMNYR
ncbi:MAG: hypothetical protein WD872_02000 [Pirellulaceae bacterium]